MTIDDNRFVTVLISVYNTDFTLTKRAIDSVLRQTHKNFEIIIIDDGSPNYIGNQILNYAIKHEDKITYLRHYNRGQSESINRGILNSKGTYITILDADDEYMPNHLLTCIKEIKNFDLIASKTHTIVNEDNDYFVPDKNDYNKLVHVDDCILFATLFGKKEVFMNLKFQKGYASDSLFYEMASLEYKTRKFDFRTYIYYRNSPSSICNRMKSQLIDN